MRRAGARSGTKKAVPAEAETALPSSGYFLTVRVVVAELEPRAALSVTDLSMVVGSVLIVKETCEAPWGTVTLAGTGAEELVEER